MKHEEDYDEQLPDSLIGELKTADKPDSLISAKVDRTIARLAREQFSPRAERRRLRAPVWYAAAASVALALFLLQIQLRPDSGSAGMYSDVDESGQIDIADVLALARRDDRTITQSELDAFAMHVVSLDESGDDT